MAALFVTSGSGSRISKPRAFRDSHRFWSHVRGFDVFDAASGGLVHRPRPAAQNRPALGDADVSRQRRGSAASGRTAGRNCARRDNTRQYGGAFWKRWTGYHVPSRTEAKMRCLKAFGERIAARDPDRQTAEIQIRIALINRFNALGTAETVRMA